MSGLIEALHIYDEQNRPILSHLYTSRPLTAAQLLPLYTAHAPPRPNLIYLPNTSPPTLVFSALHSSLLFLLTSTTEIEPLLVLEFLHRVVDVLEEFIGSPLLACKVESSYDIVAQLLNEMCDAGAVSTTEPNALRDLVEVEGWIGKLLGNINLPGKPGYSGPSNSGIAAISSASLTSNTPALPWRRANVRHTSNELYVDIVETLSVTVAPSGRALAAFASGTIACTCRISGIPDLLLSLSIPAKQNINSLMELPVFHPCVRLARWTENPGELSFIPPDGKFVLAGYGVDLLPFRDSQVSTMNSSSLKLPVTLDIKTGLGPTGSEFEVRLFINKVSGLGSSSVSVSSSRSGGIVGGRSSSGLGANATSSNPLPEDVLVTVPLPKDVRNLSEIRASRGETSYNPGGKNIEWQIAAKDALAGSATLRCAVAGLASGDADFESNGFRLEGNYHFQEDSYQSAPTKTSLAGVTEEQRDVRKAEQNKILMPSSALVSFSVRGWLASGIKVESLIINTRKSRGLGDGVKPYKGVKYVTVSRRSVEVRC